MRVTAIQVAKLTLRCDAGGRDRLRFAIEDGLRTTIPDERRLVLLRRMQVGAGASSTNPARRQDAMREGWLAAVAGARHGGDDAAANANCVWFESREEAETLLLARLLAGRAAADWYWRLAVPDWKQRPAPSWVADCLAQALAKGDDRRLLAVARCCVEAGADAILVEVLAGASGAARHWALPDASGDAAEASTRAGAFRLPPQAGAALPVPVPVPLPAGLYQAVASLLRAPGEAPRVAGTLVRAWLMLRSPALALSPTLLAATLAVTVADIRAPGQRAAPPGGSGAGVAPPVASDAVAAARTPEEAQPRLDRAREGTARASVAPSVVADIPQAAPTRDDPAFVETPASGERPRSEHAGLWLVIPSLVALGFREWLADRPALLPQEPGRLLLHAIARHHRVVHQDAALLALGPPPHLDRLPEWVGWWRHGLDRWLRRTARRRLHDLVRRPGTLTWDEWNVEIRYPARGVDLALRRLALDRDPGWTDWLGRSVRYRFGGREDWL